jgi:tetratricopeptide (TPR) repeat protein
MKRFLLFITMVLFSASPAYAADDAVARAMKLYEKRHYEEAAAGLRSELASVQQARQGAAHLTLGMLYLKNAEVYRELRDEALLAAQAYLKKLSRGSGRDRSRFADLYLGQTLIEAGKHGAAIAPLERFNAHAELDPRFRLIARADLGLCYYLTGELQKAEDLWKSIDSPDPEVLAELGAVYSKAGDKEKKSEALCDQALRDAGKGGKTPSLRIVKNALSVYVRAGATDKALEVLKRADLKTYSHREAIGKSKIIHFYDVSLLSDLAAFYSQLSIALLEKAVIDPQVKDAALYYLAAAYSRSGRVDQSAKTAASFISTTRMPQQYKDRMQALQAENDYQKGRRAAAADAWKELSQKQPLDPDLLAEVLFSCARARADCSQIVRRAETAVETGQGKKFTSLHFAIGKYHLANKNQIKAMSSMEAGRDKSNKNKIESNDPLMLLDLAGMYSRSKKFSEALEIYFEMSKQFPAIRQLQEAMQGIYVMEQKSAGDVKIF